MKRSCERSIAFNFIQERSFRFNFIQTHSFTKTFRYVSEHSAKWIVHMKVCLRSFTFKDVHLHECLRERLFPCTFDNVQKRKMCASGIVHLNPVTPPRQIFQVIFNKCSNMNELKN